MSDHIPFEIQSEIMKRLPVKSLLQFRSVSKQCKSFIDCPEFIKTYHIHNPNPQHHLLLRYKLKYDPKYTSIIDDDTFPRQKFPLTPPEPLNLLRYTTILASVDGLICLFGFYKYLKLKTWMVVLWNPCVRKCVGIPISNVLDSPEGYTRIGFGVCPKTNDPKLVKINVVKTPSICWEVQVFTLSSRVWKTVYTGAPLISCNLMSEHVFIDGVIYWSTRRSFSLSFDLKTEKFGKVSIPKRFVPTSGIRVAKVNESLGLLEYYKEGGMLLCGVWMSKVGVNKRFTKIYTVKDTGNNSAFNRVLAFRNNSEAVIEMKYHVFQKSEIEVYEPSSGHINEVGIKGDFVAAKSYIETLLLLDQSDPIIH